MKLSRRKSWFIVASLFLLSYGAASNAEPVGTAFTYQGWIADGNQPARGLYDLQFKLFDAPAAGQQIAGTVEVNDVNVVDGHFTVELDFCQPQGQQGRVLLDIFSGDARWLEIGARPALRDQGPSVQGLALEPYTIPGHRQKIMVSPYALHALSGGGLYDVLRWPSNWSLGLEEAPKLPGDAGGQSLFNVGKLGIGTASPAYPLDVAGAANLNKGKTGTALTVNGKEALWSNDTYFSWGYGGSANFFADPVGIGPEVMSPTERLDLSWSGGVNARVGGYNYLGSCFSSASLVLGNNARARTDSVSGVVVARPHDVFGYRAITMSMDGIAFHAATGKVAAGDPLANERMRITNDGKVGIGTTTPKTIFQVGTGMTSFSTFPAPTKQVCPGFAGYGTQGIGFNLFRKDDGTWETPVKSGGVALFGHFYGLSIAAVNSAPPSVPTTFTDAQIAESVWMTILADGRVGLGRWPSTNLDVNGNVSIRGMRSTTSGLLVCIDGNGELLRMTSSRRYKTNVRDLQDDPDKVLDLRPVRFQCTTTGQEDIGLIAEEVAESMKDLVIYDAEGKPEAVKYDRIALYLLSVVKAQQQRIVELEAAQAENTSLAQRIEALEQMVRQQAVVAKEVQP